MSNQFEAFLNRYKPKSNVTEGGTKLQLDPRIFNQIDNPGNPAGFYPQQPNTMNARGESYYSPPPPNTMNQQGQSFYNPPPLFGGSAQAGQNTGGGGSAQAPQSGQQSSDIPNSWMNPQTGQPYSAQEIVENMKKNMPMSSEMGDIPKYAGDAVMNPDESEEGLMGRARGMNNARNDISVGETDPYDITQGGSIVYSPQEREAIQKAYAGIYDPALNDVFARLKTREEEKKAKQDREDRIFATNESIRQWRATTGSKSAGGDGDKSQFTQTQLNNAARNSGLDKDAFAKIDDYDLINFWVQPPTDRDPDTGKTYQMNKTFENLIKLVGEGEMTAQEATDEIMDSNLPDSVKHYYIDQLPLTQEEKKGYWSKLWGAIRGK